MHNIANFLRFNINNVLIYISVFFAFWGTKFFSINASILHISFYRIMLIVFLILVAQEELRNKQYYKNPRYHKASAIIFFKLWLIYAFISLLWVPDLTSAARAIFFIIEAMLIVCVLTIHVKNIDIFYKLLQIFMICMFIHSLIGWSEIITGNYRYFPADEQRSLLIYTQLRLPVSSFHNVNDFATMMYLGFFAASIVFSLAIQRYMRYFCIICMLNFYAIIIISRSRGAIFSFVIAMIVYLLLQKKILTIAKLLFFALVAIIILLFVLNSYMEFNIMELMDSVFTFNSEQGSDEIRINLIKNGLIFLGKTLGLGTGAGNFEYYMENFKRFDTGKITNMHNFWMEILVSYGIFIFIGFIATLLRIFKHFYKLYKKREGYMRQISLLYIIFLVSFIVAAVSSSSLLGNDLVWIFLAIMIAFDCNIVCEKYRRP